MLSIKSQSQTNFDSVKSTISSLKTLTDPELIKQENSNSTASQNNTISNLVTSIETLKNDLKSLNASLELSKSDYDAKIKQSEFNITNLESTLKLNIATYEYDKKWATKEQIQKDKNDITKQEIALSDAKKTLDKYEIEAPFDWKLRQIDFKVWDNLVSDDTKYVYIDNPNLLEITAKLDQIDIAKVSINQDVSIVFDSFTSNTFTWKVTQINSSPLETSWVTSYEIKITMDKWNFAIYSWMTAKVNIIIEKKTWVLIIPSSFVTKSWDISTVLVNENWTEVQKEVITWIDNNTNIEIMTWLNEWDEVIRKITTTTVSTQSTLIPTPWSRNNSTRSSSSSSSKSSSSSSSSAGWPPPWM